MNPSIKFFCSIFVLSIFIIASTHENLQWKGYIEYENGYYLYKIDYDREVYVKIKRCKINNWDQITERYK